MIVATSYCYKCGINTTWMSVQGSNEFYCLRCIGMEREKLYRENTEQLSLENATLLARVAELENEKVSWGKRFDLLFNSINSDIPDWLADWLDKNFKVPE